MYGLDWDDQLPKELSRKIISWFEELISLPEIKVLRCPQLKEQVKSVYLHVFVDASQDTYGAVVYVKVEYENGVSSVQLVASKTKVAPLHSMSIPHLELMGAVLGNKLTQSVACVLTVSKEFITFWTDSINVLWWIRAQSRVFKLFIANRVREIQASSNPDQWRYVPTNLNPADHLQGVKLSELTRLNTWWKGPDYICKDHEFWPKNELLHKPVSAIEEVKKRYVQTTELKEIQLSHCVRMVSSKVPKDKPARRLEPRCFSSWNRLTRLYAWVMRFLNNCCTLKNNRSLEGELSPEEIIMDAEHQIIRVMQKEVFSEEYVALLKGRKLSTQSKYLDYFLD